MRSRWKGRRCPSVLERVVQHLAVAADRDAALDAIDFRCGRPETGVAFARRRRAVSDLEVIDLPGEHIEAPGDFRVAWRVAARGRPAILRRERRRGSVERSHRAFAALDPHAVRGGGIGGEHHGLEIGLALRPGEAGRRAQDVERGRRAVGVGRAGGDRTGRSPRRGGPAGARVDQVVEHPAVHGESVLGGRAGREGAVLEVHRHQTLRAVERRGDLDRPRIRADRGAQGVHLAAEVQQPALDAARAQRPDRAIDRPALRDAAEVERHAMLGERDHAGVAVEHDLGAAHELRGGPSFPLGRDASGAAQVVGARQRFDGGVERAVRSPAPRGRTGEDVEQVRGSGHLGAGARGGVENREFGVSAPVARNVLEMRDGLERRCGRRLEPGGILALEHDRAPCPHQVAFALDGEGGGRNRVGARAVRTHGEKQGDQGQWDAVPHDDLHAMWTLARQRIGTPASAGSECN